MDIDPARYDGYYNGIANRVLWLMHHYLFDLAYLPAWDMETRQIWNDYREVNHTFAKALDAERDRDPVYLVQDYQLSLVPQMLREMQPGARITKGGLKVGRVPSAYLHPQARIRTHCST